MTCYTLSYADGRTSDIHADSDAEAISVVETLLGNDIVVCDQWDDDGVNGDDEPCKRLLIWASEEDADNDDGANAIAQLGTIGRA